MRNVKTIRNPMPKETKPQLEHSGRKLIDQFLADFREIRSYLNDCQGQTRTRPGVVEQNHQYIYDVLARLEQRVNSELELKLQRSEGNKAAAERLREAADLTERVAAIEQRLATLLGQHSNITRFPVRRYRRRG